MFAAMDAAVEGGVGVVGMRPVFSDRGSRWSCGMYACPYGGGWMSVVGVTGGVINLIVVTSLRPIASMSSSVEI